MKGDILGQFAKQTRNLMETAVALADSFYSNSTRAAEFYEHFKDDVGGFPGVWAVLVDAAIAFETEVDGVFNDEFPEAINAYADGLLHKRKWSELKGNDPLSPKMLQRLARKELKPYRKSIIPNTKEKT